MFTKFLAMGFSFSDGLIRYIFWNLDEEEQQGKLQDNIIHCTIRKQDQ